MAGQQVHEEVAATWSIWFRPVIGLRQELHMLLKDADYNLSMADMAGRLMLRGAAASLRPDEKLSRNVTTDCHDWWTTMCHRSYC